MSIILKRQKFLALSSDSENVFPVLRYGILLDCRIKILQKASYWTLSLVAVLKALEVSIHLAVTLQLFLNKKNPQNPPFYLKKYLVIRFVVCNSSLNIIHKRINQAVTFSHLFPSFWASRAHVSM